MIISEFQAQAETAHSLLMQWYQTTLALQHQLLVTREHDFPTMERPMSMFLPQAPEFCQLYPIEGTLPFKVQAWLAHTSLDLLHW